MSRRSLIIAIGLMLLALLLTDAPRRNLPEKAFLSAIPIPDRGNADIPDKLEKYEPLLRQYAAEIGWDWRLLAALVYHESRFNISARSGKGAMGLMQIHSARYSSDILLNPDLNLAIGTAYLQKLEKMFEAASPADSLKFALAAYNMGDGKLRRFRTQTEMAGGNPTRWEDVSRQMPPGHHTRFYVENVLNTFHQYCLYLPD